MITLTGSQVNEIFQELAENIPQNEIGAHAALEHIKPSHHDLDCLEWRYRLVGLADGLHACKIIQHNVHENLVASVLAEREKNAEARPGRKYEYSMDILTEQDKVFSFDVPSMNPTDAYFQLTKRTAYKSIPGITSIAVYAGLQSTRIPAATPLKIFTKNELVFVSLI
jgi:hypothetical protein